MPDVCPNQHIISQICVHLKTIEKILPEKKILFDINFSAHF
jgi:hypothetical protein